MNIVQDIFADISAIRKQAPLVHNITNYVVMNTTANALLSLGASPVMAHAMDEVEEMVGISNVLVINIGTLSEVWVRAMKKAIAKAAKKDIPWILDPVGAGATSFRTRTVLELIGENPPAVIRGNASEIMSIARAAGRTKGVDSRFESEIAVEAAQELADSTAAVICISGAIDIIMNSKQKVRIRNGNPLMSRVTGLGCTATALIGAFTAVNQKVFRATCHAMAVMGIAGQIAAGKATGPGTLQLYLLDALYNLREADIRNLLQLDFE